MDCSPLIMYEGDYFMTQDTIDQILKFRDNINWKQFHNPKEFVMSCGSDLTSNSFNLKGENGNYIGPGTATTVVMFKV